VRLHHWREDADRVDGRDERERPPGQVVTRAGTPEVDVGLRPAGLLVQLGEERDEQLDHGGRTVELLHLALGEAHDRNVSHKCTL
jgi:hypothetical protein